MWIPWSATRNKIVRSRAVGALVFTSFVKKSKYSGSAMYAAALSTNTSRVTGNNLQTHSHVLAVCRIENCSEEACIVFVETEEFAEVSEEGPRHPTSAYTQQ